MKPQKLAAHWYFRDIAYCVICAYASEHRTRMYTPKPADPLERTYEREMACVRHFA